MSVIFDMDKLKQTFLFYIYIFSLLSHYYLIRNIMIIINYIDLYMCFIFILICYSSPFSYIFLT